MAVSRTDPTILLQSGKYFSFWEPEKAEFTIEDIAHALSHICRFTGHCMRFYSVAQHSVYVSQLVPPEHALAGLLHDAAEAFVGDVAKPLKNLIPQYSIIEKRVETAVFERFGIAFPLHESIKSADLTMLATEQRILMRNEDEWAGCEGHTATNLELPSMAPKIARDFFLSRFSELTRKAAA